MVCIYWMMGSLLKINHVLQDHGPRWYILTNLMRPQLLGLSLFAKFNEGVNLKLLEEEQSVNFPAGTGKDIGIKMLIGDSFCETESMTDKHTKSVPIILGFSSIEPAFMQQGVQDMFEVDKGIE